ncbi:MAG: hypothetical protein R3B09_00055 [Nannocystaceae bacterium]
MPSPRPSAGPAAPPLVGVALVGVALVGVALVGVALALVAGCVSPGAASITSDGAVEGSVSATTSSSSSTTTTTSTGTASSTSASSTSASSTSADSADTASFLDGRDVGPRPHEYCDPYGHECPEGQKCAPWSDDGYGWYQSTSCAPVARDPKAPGEPCTVEGWHYSGIDDCAEGAICWHVDPETLEGLCVAFCAGPDGEDGCLADIASCCPPDKVCEGNRVFGLCVIPCRPLGDQCYPGEVCYPVGDAFTCAPDVSGEMGAAGDPCEFLNVCDPGSFCGNPSAYPGCDPNAAGCCIPFCDLKAPTCADGTVCTPWFDPKEQEVPPLYEDLGACVLAP